MQLRGRTALVTGGSRGIGRAICLAFARERVNVIVGYLNRTEEAESLCEEIFNLGSNSSMVSADVSKVSGADYLVNHAVQTFGCVDILINNAGVVHQGTLEQLDDTEWDRIMNVNLKSAFLMTQRCLPQMRANKWGRIINISSVAAQTGGVTSPLYVASKAGLIGLTHSYASLLIKEGITSNAISPALIETDMLRKDLKLDTPDKIPLGRFGMPSEVADVAVMLSKNTYITGQTINVNGGWYFSS